MFAMDIAFAGARNCECCTGNAKTIGGGDWRDRGHSAEDVRVKFLLKEILKRVCPI